MLILKSATHSKIGIGAKHVILLKKIIKVLVQLVSKFVTLAMMCHMLAIFFKVFVNVDLIMELMNVWHSI